LTAGDVVTTTVTSVLTGGDGDDDIDIGNSQNAHYTIAINAGTGNDLIESSEHDGSDVSLHGTGGDGDDRIVAPTTVGIVSIIRNDVRGNRGADELRGGDGVDTVNRFDTGYDTVVDVCYHGINNTDSFKRCNVVI